MRSLGSGQADFSPTLGDYCYVHGIHLLVVVQVVARIPSWRLQCIAPVERHTLASDSLGVVTIPARFGYYETRFTR